MENQQPVRVRMALAYDGSPFQGWGIQPGAPTVQGVVEASLSTVFQRLVRTTVAGRTDAGVHARGQVAHFDLEPGEWAALVRHAASDSTSDLSRAAIRRLGGLVSRHVVRMTGTESARGAVVIRRLEVAPGGFDARFSALWRRYSYTVADGPSPMDPLRRAHVLDVRGDLDVEAMNEAAGLMLGLRDFHAFCRPRPGATAVRDLHRMEWVRDPGGTATLHITADAFCHNMVRALVGASLMVGLGDRAPRWLEERLLKGERNSEANLAPPHALVLEEIGYPGPEELADRAEKTRARRGAAARTARN